MMQGKRGGTTAHHQRSRPSAAPSPSALADPSRRAPHPAEPVDILQEIGGETEGQWGPPWGPLVGCLAQVLHGWP